jgi:hypothetical protein
VRLSFVDRWVIGYSVATSLAAVLWGGDAEAFRQSHLFHALAVATALAAARWIPARGRIFPFVRHGYPILLLGFFYQDTGPYVFLFFKDWFDPQLLAFEEALFGFNVPAAVARITSVWLLETWMAGYLFYYLMLPLATAVAFVRNDPGTYRRMMEAAIVVFFVSFSLFALYPLEGPRHALVSVLPPIKGGVFFGLVMAIQNSGSIHGGCMPSSHTAVAWVVTWYVYRMDRRVGLALVLISSLLSVGCFWGRFHYVTDVLVGLALFALAVAYTEWRHRGTARAEHASRSQETLCTR